MPKPPDEPFYIAFEGQPQRFAPLSRFYDRLRAVKVKYGGPVDDDDLDTIVSDPTWCDLLDADSLETLADPTKWDFESMMESILLGEYTFERLSFDGSKGMLVYDPLAWPFGTDPLVGLIETFGFKVTRNSWVDDLP
jgi:hypothetical protein